MMLAQAEIDRVVREVLQRLLEAQAAAPAGSATLSAAALTAATPASSMAAAPSTVVSTITVAKPVAKPTDTLTDTLTDTPRDRQAGKPIGPSIGQSFGPSVGPSVGSSVGKSVAKAFNPPAATAVAKAVAKPVAKPVAKSGAKPSFKAAEKPAEKPAEKLFAKQAEKPAAKPVAMAAGKPQSAPVSRPAPQSVAPQSVAPQSVAPQSVAPQSVAPQSVAVLSSAADSRVWDFRERLVTVATLDAMPSGTRVLSTRPGTVITPSARDRLRQLRVELSITSGAVVASAAPTLKLYLHAAKDPAKLAKAQAPRVATYRSNRFGAAPAVSPHSWPARQSVLRALQGVNAALETLIAAPLEQTAAELSAVLAAPHHLGVLFTTERDWAACVANRRESIRAVVATDKVSIEAAARDWGANLLIIDDRRSSPHTIRGWIDTFLRPGPRICPANRRDWLEG